MRKNSFEAADPAGDEHVDPETAAQTIGEFIDQVIELARKREDFDSTLITILLNHIIKEHPTEDAVAVAAAQIEALADTRASVREQEAPDRGDHA